jgi:hypothetical protein
MIRRDFGPMTQDEFMAIAESSTATREAQFPEINWDRTHVQLHENGAWTTYCIYDTPDIEAIRLYSAATNMPIDAEIEIAMDVVAGDPLPVAARS